MGYWENINKIYEKQRKKGIENYGMTIEQNQIPEVIERIEYLQEEMVDALIYCEWIKDKLNSTISK